MAIGALQGGDLEMGYNETMERHFDRLLFHLLVALVLCIISTHP